MRVRKVVRHILLCHIDLRKCESEESGDKWKVFGDWVSWCGLRKY